MQQMLDPELEVWEVGEEGKAEPLHKYDVLN